MLLRILREGAQSGVGKFILFGLMTLAVFGLVLMDVGGFFNNGGPASNTVAVVGGQNISAPAFDDRARRLLARQGVDAPTAYRLGFMNQILEGEIATAVIYREAHELGLRIDDTVMARQVSQLVKPYVTPEMSGKEALRRILMNQGMSEQQFVQALRTETANTILRRAVLTGSGYVPPQEARALYQYRNEKRTLKMVILPQDAVKDVGAPSDEDLRPLYEAGKEQFAIPETRRITLAVLNPAGIEKTMSIEEDELRQVYEEDKDSFKTPETRTLEQSVLPDEAQAVAVAEKVKGGAALKDAIKAVTGKTDAWLGQDKFQREGMAEGVADAAFGAEKGAVAGPVQTALGWHVLVVRDIKPETVRPYEDVRAELRKELMQSRLADQLYAVSGQIDDQIAGGAALQEVADTHGMTLESYGPLRADGSTPDDKDGMKAREKDRVDILKTAFDLQEGEASPVMELSNGHYAVLQVEAITPKAYKPFEDVRGAIARIWTADRQQSLNKQKAQDALKALAAGDKSLDDIARAGKAKVQTVTISRADEAAHGLNPPAIAHFFSTPVDEYAMATVGNGIAIVRVTAATLPAADKIGDKELATLIRAESRNLQQETFQAYMARLRKTYNVKVHDKVLQAMYSPAAGEM